MKLQEPYFSKMLDLKYGVPSADTLLRVFAIIEPEKFMEMFYQWIRDVLATIQENKETESQHIAIDGKAVRAATVKGGHGKLLREVSSSSIPQSSDGLECFYKDMLEGGK